MSIKLNVPFYPNTPDNTHCFQVALRMVLEYFWPHKEFSWKDLEKITAKVEGLWTWPMAGMLWMHKNGFEVQGVELFDYEEFAKKGGQYLIENYGNDVAQEQIKQSYLPQEVKFAKQLLEKGLVKTSLPTKQTIFDFLNKKNLVICNINMQTLNSLPGYVGHFVVIIGYDKEGFFLHDPGLPPQKDRHVNFKDFESAWDFPNKKARNVMAFGLKD